MKKIIYAVVAIITGISVFYAFSGGESLEEYKERVLKQRKDRVRFLKNSSESPLRLNPKKADSLTYYPIDQKYAVRADITVLESKTYITIRTNDGQKQKFLKYGYAQFELNESTYKLLLLRPLGEKKVLVAFADHTSGEETYGGGRYLDMELSQNSKAIIDFNLSYNPYCAYNAGYSCPLPPVDNILSVAIEAGEKMN